MIPALNAIDSIVCGYCDKGCPNDIIRLIMQYINLATFRYFDSRCDETPFKAIQHIHARKFNFKHWYHSEFNRWKCKHCHGYNPLEYRKSYTQIIDDNFVGFVDHINEYQCNTCHYYTTFNVKINIVHNHWFGSLNRKSICYINPFQFDWKDEENELIQLHTYRRRRSGKYENYKGALNCPCCNARGSIKQFEKWKSSKFVCSKPEYGDYWHSSWTGFSEKGMRLVMHCNNCKLYIHRVQKALDWNGASLDDMHQGYRVISLVNE